VGRSRKWEREAFRWTAATMSIRDKLNAAMGGDPGEPPAATAVLEVPASHTRDDAPPGEYRIACQYLLGDSRMSRREVTLQVSVAEVVTRTIEVDLSLPTIDCGAELWYLPVAYFPKGRVAPSLDVFDGEENALPVPTKRENMGLTERAIEALLDRGQLRLGESAHDPRKIVELIQEVISKPYPDALVPRLVFADEVPNASPMLRDLLDLLADQFLLWVPITGSPGTRHHIFIRRCDFQEANPIRTPVYRDETFTVETALGEVEVSAPVPTGRSRPDFPLAVDRLLSAFALRPIEVRFPDAEAKRFASSHLRLVSPDGFLVRNVRAAAVDPPGSGGKRVEELGATDHVVVQGHDRKLAHIQLAEEHNPPYLYSRITLALRGGMTTLWMLAAVLTAGLLWLVKHHHSYGHPDLQNKQIVAAVLLVGPAFASAWSLRADRGELLRAVVAGARGLLLLSAALSVAAALALADVFPSWTNRHEMVELCAAISYFVAMPLIAAWILASRPTWLVFRGGLRTQHRNLAAICALGVAVLLAGLHQGLPMRATGVVLALAALALAAIAANSVAEPLISSQTFYRPLAGAGGLLVTALAGYFLGYYADICPIEDARLTTVLVGGLLALVALSGFVRQPKETAAGSG
jgi:hypothetical protein